MSPLDLLLIRIFTSVAYVCGNECSTQRDYVWTRFIMDTYKLDKDHVESLSRQTTTAEGQLEKKFSKLTMTGMAFAILK